MDWNKLLPWAPGAAVVIGLATFLLNGNFERIAWLWRWRAKRRPEVVIGVVCHKGNVLLVHRRPNPQSALRWQFPAGQLTDSYPDATARLRSEILAETGIVVQVGGEIGRRVHSDTKKFCIYYACTYVEGSVSNADPQENIDVCWVEAGEVRAYIGKGLFPKVKKWIETQGE